MTFRDSIRRAVRSAFEEENLYPFQEMRTLYMFFYEFLKQPTTRPCATFYFLCL
jgi:hypothetical protein